ncbi:MAG TPA: non-homologous end-joining DNA ligase [bacterium]|nr:non-homologous end-joining DNA ligase [bacterium]
MLAEAGKAAFDSPEWTYEPKWDGIRILAHVQQDRVRLWSRNLENYTGLFAPVADSLKSITVPVVLDGEVVAVGADGLPDFGALQQWLRPGSRPRTGHVSYVVFDCLYVDGHTLRDRPLKERQDVLAALKPVLTSDFVRVTDPFPGALGTFVYEECQRQGLEGVVAKRLASTYRPGKRSKDWRKMAFHRREEFVVGGYLSSAPNRLSALILGQYDRKEKLAYAGLVGGGLSVGARKAILEQLKTMVTAVSPFRSVPTLRDHWGEMRTDLRPQWVKPTLVVEVEYRERLEDGLRHAALKALRPDKTPRAVRRA